MNFGVGGKMYDQVKIRRVFRMANPSLKVAVGHAQILEQSLDIIGPGIWPFIYTKNIMTPLLQIEA